MGLETRATQLTDSNQSENSRYPIYQSAKKVEANHYVHVTFPALFILAVLICFSVYNIKMAAAKGVKAFKSNRL